MEQVYQFNLDKFINYYDYDQCNEKSDDEYSDNEEKDQAHCFSEEALGNEEPTTESENNPFGSGSSASYPKEKSNSMGSASLKSGKHKQLPKSIKFCLDGFSEKMAKTKSFHQKLSNKSLLPTKSAETTKSIC